MKHVELNQKGNFDLWDQNKLVELLSLKTNEAQNKDSLIFQNERIRLSVLIMEPYERIPFRMFKTDFNLVCLSGGTLISRYGNGGILLKLFDKGEEEKHTVDKKPMINDFQNVGENLLVLAVVEHLCSREFMEVPYYYGESQQPLFSKN